ncbi:uncharacterized protein GGS22DRAFT_187686 [Annulohypoxylon maeteangense]|uniref:uncharacterized protein n=1 Tax=Annulohypoxylon maeteangense TaxID=1927788 RepID=UPI002008B5C3|nr:uncharacterized protein GGS22DRAFT_187686 [Annulohypoxylon maeteangense]KAI0886441.1 hypothetical protein GGS22DRAFT_187686 [Annulohypoxylon maeteangense]
MVFASSTITATPAALKPRATSLNHDGTPPVAPLTTVWTASPGCFPVSTRSTTDIDMFWTSHTDCAPPGYASYFETYYYSPGICPSGFTVGCSRYGDFQGPSVEPTETAMLCVMSNYFCTPGAWNYYATNTDLSYAQVMIQIRWAESDLSILETHPLTPGLKIATTGTESSATVTVISSNLGRSGEGLSTGAQVGIGVGAGLFGLLAIGLAVFFILRYRKRRAGSQDTSQIPSTQQPQDQYPQTLISGQQSQPAQGYPGYTPYVDPNTGAISYYSPIPRPTELGGTAIKSLTNITPSQGAPSITGPQSTYLRDPAVLDGKSILIQNSMGTGTPNTSPVGIDLTNESPLLAEMPGSEGIARSVGDSENSQVQQEIAHLMTEQAKLDARRTRLMELAELDEEEQRIRIRMHQLQSGP